MPLVYEEQTDVKPKTAARIQPTVSELRFAVGRANMDLPKPGKGLREGLSPLITDPFTILLVGDFLGQQAFGRTSPQEVEELERDIDILLQTFADVRARSGGPAEDDGLQQRRVCDAWMGGAEAGEEPGRMRSGAVQSGEDQFADGVEVQTAEEGRDGAGPGVGVYDEDGDGDVGVERAALFTWV